MDGAGQIYLRTDNGEPDASTVRISASERSTPDPCETDPETCPEARYQYATPDGLHAFFTTSEPLLDSDTTPSGFERLYEYNVTPDAQGHHLRLLSTPDPGHQASVEGVIGVSDDGSYVYFTTKSNQLLAGGHPESQNSRIYLWHDGLLHEVANLSENAAINATASAGRRQSPKTARVSPDGRHLLFAAAGNADAPHSGLGDTCSSVEPGATGCGEVFVYAAAAAGGRGSLVCASCRQGEPSAPAAGDAGIYTQVGAGLNLKDTHLNRPLSVTGHYAFFSTADGLLPDDTNGVSDVYEFDADTGRLALVSSGTDPNPSYFMDASESGEDVFFTTRQSLLGWDTDGTGYDLYDARVGGGVAEPPLTSALCQGETCQGSATTAPPSPTSSSSAFNGPANPAPKRCPKGKVKKSGKCVKKSSKKHHGKKHHGKKASHNRGGSK